MLYLIIILVIIIVALMVYNMIVYKKIQSYNNINQKVTGLNVLQGFMNTIGEATSADDKIKKINDILIEKYEIKYSTIVIFDGSEYAIKASNVSEKHWDTLRSLHNQEIFKDSISTTNPKYITVNDPAERLPYQTMEFGRAKSAMFFPLYIDNVYIGYWIIESGIAHDFEKIDTTILEVIRENIISVYKTISYQNVIEHTVRQDLFSGLKSEQYLYGEGKKIIDKFTTSTVCMFRITNIEQINEEYSRQTGNNVITKISEYIQNSISERYVFVRYMGPKFVIVFSGVETDGVTEFVEELKENIETQKIQEVKPENTKTNKKEKIRYAIPKLNFVISTYYKGTALEGVTKKMEEYLDNASKEENDINYI